MPAANNLTHALALAQRGLRVFPVKPGTKRPADDFLWTQWASNDPDTIRTWFTGLYADHGVAAAGGNGFFMVDADVKDGERGLQSLDLMSMMGADLAFVVATPSGGRHAYFRVTDGQQVPTSVKQMPDFPGIDIRGDGGYVVAPGTPGYEIVSSGPTPEAPPWLLDDARKGKRSRERNVSDALSDVPLDDEANVQRAIHWLRHSAKLAVQGERNIRAFETVCMVRDFGISGELALLLVDQHWNHNEAKVEAPLELDELETIVDSAYRGNADNRHAGSKSALAEFDAVEVIDRRNAPTTQDADPPPRGLYLIDYPEAVAAATQDPLPHLIDGVYSQDTFNVVYGPSNSGKTFLTLGQAYCVAANLPWNGHEVSPGAVVYVAAEGGRGINKRVAALNIRHQPATPPPLALIPCPVDLNKSKADIAKIIELATDYAKQKGQPLRLIVIDTLSRALAGGDENSSVDMGNFIKNIDRLRSRAGCAVLVVHHTGKVVANGARGWSGLRAAIDSEIEVQDGGVISFEKQRDIEKIEPVRFRLATVVVGKDAKGGEITSCVLEPLTKAQIEFEDGLVDVAPSVREYLDTLVAMIADGVAAPVSVRQWDDAYFEFLSEQGRQPTLAKTTRRYRATLIESGWVRAIPSGRTQVFEMTEALG